MTKTTLRIVVLLLTVATSMAFAHPVAQTAEAVLHANEEAMDDFPKVGTLRVQYATEVSGGAQVSYVGREQTDAKTARSSRSDSAGRLPFRRVVRCGARTCTRAECLCAPDCTCTGR